MLKKMLFLHLVKIRYNLRRYSNIKADTPPPGTLILGDYGLSSASVLKTTKASYIYGSFVVFLFVTK